MKISPFQIKLQELFKEHVPNKYSVDMRILPIIDFKNIGISLSVQASEYHHCTPQLTLPDAKLYEAIEFAIFKDDKWSSVEEICPDLNSAEFKVSFDGMIYAYVSVDSISKLFDKLLEINNNTILLEE